MLCPLNNGSTNVRLVWPKGSHFHFVVGSPDAQSNIFSELNVVAANQDRVRTLKNATNAFAPSNWLQHEGLNGYIIASPTNAETMPDAGSAVDIHIYVPVQME